MDRVLRQALLLVTPSEEERRKADEAAKELKKRLELMLKSYPQLEYRFLGSYARNTWLKESLEIDVFILFPEETSNEELERIGIEIGKAVVDEQWISYAAHPYVHGRMKGIDVDIVPCYRLKSAEKIKSAVDRTPFHHEWLKDRIKGKESEVRMLKKFLKAGGIYGAEYKVRGFSGYLCELLIVFYGSFYRVVENATKWTRNTVLDVLNNRAYRKKGLKNMLVIDPVDAKRNVAANLSLDNLARFVERCRNFLENPSVEFFIEKALPTQPIRAEIEKRGTGLYVVEFEKPDIVEDNLYPQLERACKKIHEFLKRSKFMPLRSAHFVGKKCYLIFETEVKELSKIEKHEGPPFEDYENVKKFLERRKYAPFIENGKYFVYAERRHCKAEDAIADFVQKEWRALGKNIGEKLRKCRILKDEFENLGFLFDFLSLKR